MASVNKVMVLGNVGGDLELKRTTNGNAYVNFSVATSEKWKGKDGQMQERTEWHTIVAWGKVGELCAEYLGKGSMVYIEGKIQTRDWEDKDGNKRKNTEVNAHTVQFLDSKKSAGVPCANLGGGHPAPTPDDDIPF